MIELLPLPITWLAFFLLGWAAQGRSLTFHRYLVALASIGLLLATTGWLTTGFYVVVGLSVIVAGKIVCLLDKRWLAHSVLVVALLALLSALLAYMTWRHYFQKYFVLLPSLSYLIFRAISFLITTYRQRRLEPSAGLMQMVFFPMLFTGPIARVEDFEQRRWDYCDVLRRMVLGFGMLTLAGLINPYVPTARNVKLGIDCAQSWIGLFASSFDLYLSFSGWTHLVIGLGLLAGFKLPENFNSPYLATSLSDFWRRWHISLSFWIRDYVYIPLGGNRKGLPRKCINLTLAMGLCGLWHGLTLNFLAWGLFHGLVLSAESVLDAYKLQPVKGILPRFHRPIKIIFIFMLVTWSWLLFRYPVPVVLLYIRGLVPW